MLLAIDCGNTNTKFGIYDGLAPDGVFRHVFRIDTDSGLSSVDYHARLAEELDGAGLVPRQIDGVAIASVVPAAEPRLAEFARALTGAEPVVIGGAGVELGLQVLIDNPSEAGADRLVNAVAVQAANEGPAIVLDFGTGTTFDVVTAAGDYAGGVIAPGINLALDALYARGARLPQIDIAKPDRVIGTNTVSAMQSGIYWGYIGLIEGVLERVKAEYARTGGEGAFTVIATGGLAPLFADGTDVIDRIDPELTLRGIVLVHQRNQTA